MAVFQFCLPTEVAIIFLNFIHLTANCKLNEHMYTRFKCLYERAQSPSIGCVELKIDGMVFFFIIYLYICVLTSI